MLAPLQYAVSPPHWICKPCVFFYSSICLPLNGFYVPTLVPHVGSCHQSAETQQFQNSRGFQFTSQIYVNNYSTPKMSTQRTENSLDISTSCTCGWGKSFYLILSFCRKCSWFTILKFLPDFQGRIGNQDHPVSWNYWGCKKRIQSKGTAALLMNTETKWSPQVPQQLWTKPSEAADDCWAECKTLSGATKQWWDKHPQGSWASVSVHGLWVDHMASIYWEIRCRKVSFWGVRVQWFSKQGFSPWLSWMPCVDQVGFKFRGTCLCILSASIKCVCAKMPC